MKRWIIVALVACSSKSKAPPDATPLPPPEAPLRDATGDADVRALVADLLSARACDQAIHRFSGIKDAINKELLSGDVWIRECKITDSGPHVTVELAGDGWQWGEQTQKKAGGTFGIKQYVKFAVTAKLTGTIDIAYDRPSHIASLWFTPAAEPEVTFKPIGDIEVDPKSTWASLVGDAGSLIGSSPEDAAGSAAKSQGKKAVVQAASRGFEFAVDLCRNLTRMSRKRLPKGQMPKPSVGETDEMAIKVQNFGVMMEGPYDAHVGMTIDVDVEGGAAKVNLACVAEAEATAQAFLDEKINTAKPIKSELVTGHAVLKVPKEHCPVVVVIRSMQPNPVTISYVRPAAEATESKGGPLARCGSQ